ncbi:uncharacterized protein LOC134228124 [Armigeres subalbatus]|uniref:uncharacterized protein LOC134228124 n=1 Tax=Armigeres subalbatus TaxID=124917 RepID=UPI002ED1894E
MQLIGEAMLLIVLTSFNTDKVRLTCDAAAASIDVAPSTTTPESSSRRFILNVQRHATQRPTLNSSATSTVSQGWFRQKLAIYSRIQPRVVRDTTWAEENGQYSEEFVWKK